MQAVLDAGRAGGRGDQGTVPGATNVIDTKRAFQAVAPTRIVEPLGFGLGALRTQGTHKKTAR